MGYGWQRGWQPVRAILANTEHATTAHDLAATATRDELPARVRGAVDHRSATLGRRALEYVRWHTAVTLDNAACDARSNDIGLVRSNDAGVEL